MESQQSTSIESQLRALQSAFLQNFGNPEALPQLSGAWRMLVVEIERLHNQNSLKASTQALARVVATNISMTAHKVHALQRIADSEAEDLAVKLQHLSVHQTLCVQHKKKRSQPTDCFTPPAQRRKPSSPAYCLSPSSSITSGSSSSSSSLTPLRHWFLDNLAYPFLHTTDIPTISERTSLSLKQINTYLTNWRRRSGWTHFRETYANRSRDGTEVLLSRLIALEQGEYIEPIVDSKTLLHLDLWDKIPEETRKNIKGSRKCKMDLGGRLKLGYSLDEEDDMLRSLADIRKYIEKDNEDVGQWIRKVVEAAPRSLSTSSSSSSISTVSDVSERLRSVSGWSTPPKPSSKPELKTKTYNWKHTTPDYFTFGQDSKTFEPELPLYEHGVASWNEV